MKQNYILIVILVTQLINNRTFNMTKTVQILIVSVFFCISGVKATAQSSTTMQDIYETVNEKVVKLEEENNKEIVNMTFDLLVNQNSKSIYRFLDGAFTYDITVLGDRRISRLKLSVYKQAADDWELVDQAAGSNPKIKIYPAGFEEYRFVVTVDDFKGSNNAGHFALILYHDNPEKTR